MPQKTKIIFITVFILVGALMLGLYFYFSSKSSTTPTTIGGIAQKFNPFGKSTDITTTTTTPEDEEGATTETGEQGLVANSRFRQITTFAISGAIYFDEIKPLPLKETISGTGAVTQTTPTPTTTKTPTQKGVRVINPPTPIFELVPSLRYVERATGHVYQMYIDGWIEGKIANSTLPGTQEAIFDSKATSIIYRYLSPGNDSITSFLAQLGGNAGNFLATNILEISLSPGKDKYFSLTKNTSGAVGTLRSFGDNKSTQVFTSAFSEWLPQWVTDKNIYLTTKPSYQVEGSVYSLNIANGVLTKVLGGIPGLTTLANNTATKVLYGNGIRLSVFDIKSHTSADLGKYGLPEKCVWSSDAINIYCAVPNNIEGSQFPDVWYQGLISFDDSFIKINTITREINTMANSENEIPVDATKLFLNNDESKLFFVNKKDYTLWSFTLK